MRISERKDFYRWDQEHLKDRTKSRLLRIESAGMTEVGIGEFGANGVMSGFYIERVWHFSDEEFDEYINWAISVIEKSKS